MSEIDIASYDLNDGGARQKLLETIPPDRATVKERHQLLLDVFRREMASRREEGYDLEGNLFETYTGALYCSIWSAIQRTLR